MNITIPHILSRSRAIMAGAVLLAACGDDTALAPDRQAAVGPQLATLSASSDEKALATLRRVTARYHDLNVAISEGFVLLHECENRPDEGPVGAVYVHMGRLLDGAINPETPDALIYEPRRNGRARLVGVEFAIPYPLWTKAQPPEFLGATFQPEDEFGVFALHAWVWRNNPEGMFAESNPRVSCLAE